VEVRLFTADKMVCLEVKDHGEGIEKEELIHLFEPFYRSKQHINQPGSGIGLSLVKSIMDKYHGSIHIQSELGKGTVLTIKLPVY
jgi:signal transduction histidine kinase